MVLFNLILTSVSVLNLFNKYIVLLNSKFTLVINLCQSEIQCLDVVEVLSLLRSKEQLVF